MNRLLTMLAVALLAACGGGGNPAPIQPPPVAPATSETVLVSQPAIVPTFNNVSPPRGVAGVTLWGPHERLPSPPTNATSRDGVLDIVIDSNSIRGNVAARFGLGTVVLGWSPKTPIRATQYRYSYDLRVSRADGPGVAQVVSYLNLRDRVNGANLWLGQIIFDTRCSKAGEVAWDTGTNTPMVNVLAANFSCSTFGDWRPVSFVVGPAQIEWATAQLRARYPALRLSANAGDYEVSHINVNPEVATASGSARIDVGIRNWQLTQQETK